jgi:hypothetical protein
MARKIRVVKCNASKCCVPGEVLRDIVGGRHGCLKHKDVILDATGGDGLLGSDCRTRGPCRFNHLAAEMSSCPRIYHMRYLAEVNYRRDTTAAKVAVALKKLNL